MKHAYLIIAHNNFYVLKSLLILLDDNRNDIYLHIDKKTVLDNQLKIQLMSLLRKSKLYLLDDRIDIHWGDISQVKAEYLLFKTAYYNDNYSYYHLLSGIDLPIKSQDYIHRFFTENAGKEFVGFFTENESYVDNIAFFYLFPASFRSKNILKRILRVSFLNLQKLLNYSRDTLHLGALKKGTNWVSITSDLVAFLLEKESLVLKSFKYSYCPDEMFIQTLVYNSPFKEKCYSLISEFDGCMRLIDWTRGHPYVWQIDDLFLIKESNRLFARKFGEEDTLLIDTICRLYS